MPSMRWTAKLAVIALPVAILAGAAFVAAVEPAGIVTLVVAGDIMLSRKVAATMKAADDPELPFRKMADLLKSADLSFANLESPLAPGEESEAGWDGVIGGESLIFAAPHRSLQALRRFHFGILSLANNHAMDQGEAGLMHTLAWLRAHGIQAAGAGRSLDEAWQPRIVELSGHRIGFIAASYASTNYESNEPNDYIARIEQLDRLRSSLHALKSQAGYIVVSMHAGDEYTGEPSAAQVKFAHAAVDGGANLVVGSHPHWLQPFERYKKGLIFYSLGNFIFDLNSSPATREGAVLRLFLRAGQLVHADVIPVEIEDSCCPRAARLDETREALRRMRLASTNVPVCP
jgi:poly-gamma-glutamate capsule biosynthesis protein CapA/YwtB (metallophosphatase superfamily)